MPAIGAVLKDMEQGFRSGFDLEKLAEFISSLKDDESGQQPLCDNIDEFDKKHKVSYYIHKPDTTEKVKAYLGIDIGSISTNLAVTDEEDRLLAKRYLMTAGRPIEAVKQGLDEIGIEVGDAVNICGVGTTGSGRYMIADFVGADIVKNEITAQAQAAVEIDPGVDTILEIGGQDSKYISIRDGVIVDFEMNKACAAGTGSFLEEQAEKLDISVKQDFASIAFESKKPCVLGERCTVFMENSLLSKQQRGAPKEDLVSGLSYSIVQNYVNRVVGERPIGDKVFFQGGVAFNKSVIAAFEKYLDKNIIVPPHHDVTGAIGMAMIAKKHVNGNGTSCSSFKGFDLSKRNYSIKSFECKGCENICEINRVKVDGEETPLFYGSRCEKYDVKRKSNENEGSAMPDLFKERENLLEKAHEEYLERSDNGSGKKRPRIGIPRIFFFHDLLPYWSTLLWELGFEVELSSSTNRQIVNKGIENIITESCYPHKIAHGHIKDLIDKEVDAVFLPSFINFNADRGPLRSFACPYAQTIPYIAEVAFDDLDIIKPAINMEYGSRHVAKEIFRSLEKFNISRSAFKKALARAEAAQKEFNTAIKERGREVLGKINERTIVIVGRAYNAFDPGINLEIPKKLAALGVFSIPQDFLPVESIDISGKWTNMYWRSGQNILKAAEIIKDNPKLFALYIGNFSCGPDSFIHRYFNETMAGKPFLQIEIDEHSADAGVITRCEAFLDSISSRGDIPADKFETLNILSIDKRTTGKTVYLPRMSDHAFGLAAAFRMCGLNAEVMDSPTPGTVKIGRRHVSGKECYPCAITTGDMVNKTLSNDFDHKRSVFFMPSGTGPCRFGQYNILQRLVLDDIGLSHVPIYSPNQDGAFYTELGIVGNDFTKQAWRGIVAIDLLMKCLHETRPYEVHKGETEGLYNEYLFKMFDLLQEKSADVPNLLNEIRRSFSAIQKNREKRPLIGIIGEIFVRHNAFANENIIKKVEALGGEVWLAPAEEWLYYVNHMAIRKSWIQLKNDPFSRSHLKDITSAVITRHVKNGVEHEYSKPFKGYLNTLKEPSTREMFRNALPYLPDSFEGETVLSMGKAVDFAAKGASGIISAMPFGCMPGTIVSALLKGFKEDAGIPCLSVAYDGSEANCSGIQLEAFMHQAGNFMAIKG